MSRFGGILFLGGLSLALCAGAWGQGNYRPGQTFSVGQTPASASTPLPVYRPQVAPQPAVAPVQRRQAAPASAFSTRSDGSMYNLAPQRSSSSPSRSSSKPDEDAVKPSRSSAAVKKASTKEAVSEKRESASEKSKPVADEAKPETATKETASAAAPKADDKPAAPESTDKLVFFSRKTGKKQIALTYDDGPNPTLTGELIDWLKANNVPATFFMQGEMVKTHPELAKRVADDGFELANHTYSHPDLRKQSEEKIMDELQDTHDLIKNATGVDVKLMRPPYGAHNSKVDEICKRLGYKIINWDVDTNDWRNRSTEAMVNTIMSTAGDGSIILMHDRKHKGKSTVLETTKSVVPQLRAKGYTFVTVGELIGLNDASAPAAAPASPVIAQPAPAAPADVVTSAPAQAPILP
jgi:peptidoglycan/xylan/chitin deacetylase (PgdA/CDA1 family)